MILPKIHIHQRVVIESPFRALTEDMSRTYKDYLRRAILDSIHRGEAPYASHLFYTQFLDDRVQYERHLGMSMGFSWGMQAELVAVYEDYGISDGMEVGINTYRHHSIPVVYRKINAT